MRLRSQVNSHHLDLEYQIETSTPEQETNATYKSDNSTDRRGNEQIFKQDASAHNDMTDVWLNMTINAGRYSHCILQTHYGDDRYHHLHETRDLSEKQSSS
jgi:hypothetical protein